MTNNPHYQRELELVLHVGRLIYPQIKDCRDPRVEFGRETGADVLTFIDKLRIGIQVTEFTNLEDDDRDVSHRRQADEMKRVQTALKCQVTPVTWAPTDFTKPILTRIHEKVEKAKKYDFKEFDEVWLLISANLPDLKRIGASFAFKPCVEEGLRNAAIVEKLAESKYHKMLLHVIVGRTIYQWERGTNWKTVYDEPDDMPPNEGGDLWFKKLLPPFP